MRLFLFLAFLYLLDLILQGIFIKAIKPALHYLGIHFIATILTERVLNQSSPMLIVFQFIDIADNYQTLSTS